MIQQSALRQQSFVNHLNAMRQHYASGATTQYPLPSKAAQPRLSALASAVVAPNTNAASGEMRRTSEEMKSQIKGVLDSAKGDFLRSVADSKGNTDDFKSKLEAQKAKIKEDLNTIVDKGFKSAERIGTEFPDTQDWILQGISVVVSFVTTLATTIMDWINSAIEAIVSAIRAGIDWVKKAAADVEGFISNTWKSVEDFFSGIF
jgi:hypothetical protein